MFKTLSLSLAAVIASASIAAADSYILPFDHIQKNDAQVELSTVRAAGPGMLEVYAYNGGQMGKMLGETAIHSGANSDVKVNLSQPAPEGVIALLKVSGQVVDSQRITFN